MTDLYNFRYPHKDSLARLNSGGANSISASFTPSLQQIEGDGGRRTGVVNSGGSGYSGVSAYSGASGYSLGGTAEDPGTVNDLSI